MNLLTIDWGILKTLLEKSIFNKAADYQWYQPWNCLGKFLIISKRQRQSSGGVPYKKVFLKILQDSKENTCARVSFLIKLQVKAGNFSKSRLWHRCFPVNFAKFLRTYFYLKQLRWLLLKKPFSRSLLDEFYVMRLNFNQAFGFPRLKPVFRTYKNNWFALCYNFLVPI